MAAESIHLVRPKWVAVLALAAILIGEISGLPQCYRYRRDYQEWEAAADYLVVNQPSVTTSKAVLLLAAPSHPADAPQSQPLSVTDWRFHDGCASPAGSSAAANPAVPELKLAVSSLRSRHWPCPRRLQAPVGVNVPDAILVGRFSGEAIGRLWVVAEDQRPGDAAVFCVAHGRLLFEYYRDRYHPNLQGLDLVYPDLRNETTDPRALSYFPPLSAGQLDAIIANHRRVWFVVYPDDWAPGLETSRQVQAALAAAYPHIQETKVYTVILRLYSKDHVDSGRQANTLTSGLSSDGAPQ